MPIGLKGFQRKELNPMWKGDDVGYKALHEWIKNNLFKPSCCDICGKEKRLDLANISQKYFRDVTDWEWLCRDCHMEKDGRKDNLIMRNKSGARRIIKFSDYPELIAKFKEVSKNRARDNTGRFIKK